MNKTRYRITYIFSGLERILLVDLDAQEYHALMKTLFNDMSPDLKLIDINGRIYRFSIETMRLTIFIVGRADVN